MFVRAGQGRAPVLWQSVAAVLPNDRAGESGIAIP
jgi:hypothetical protein